MDDLLALAGWFLVEIVLLSTGRAVVFLVTFGRWRGERLRSKEARVYGLAGALSFKHEGQRVVTANGLLLVGGIFYSALLVLLLFLAVQ